MHPDDEALSAYADDPDGAPGAKQIAEHLAVCPDCAGFVLSVRELDAMLSSADTWAYAEERRVTTGVPEELLEILRANVVEDEEAQELLEPLLRNPLVFLWTDLAAKPRYRTAGVVRRLCEEVVTACEVDPPHARDLAEAAMLLIESLDPRRYAEEEITTLRAGAWKARATALRRLGDFAGALSALQRAERELLTLNGRPTISGDIAYVRADVLSAMGRLEEAEMQARIARDAFIDQGRTKRFFQVQLLAGVIALRRRDYQAARDLFLPILDQAEADGDLALVAGTSHNLGSLYMDIGDTGLASKYLLTAISGWDALEKPTEAARAKWLLAKLHLANGRFAEAAQRLEEVQQQMSLMHMADDVALVRLQRVEALLLAGRTKEARGVCRGLVKELMDLGIKPAAYKALAYVQELSRGGTLDVPAVRSAGEFIRELRDNPTLLFVPPPPSDRPKS